MNPSNANPSIEFSIFRSMVSNLRFIAMITSWFQFDPISNDSTLVCRLEYVELNCCNCASTFFIRVSSAIGELIARRIAGWGTALNFLLCSLQLFTTDCDCFRLTILQFGNLNSLELPVSASPFNSEQKYQHSQLRANPPASPSKFDLRVTCSFKICYWRLQPEIVGITTGIVGITAKNHWL